jgi:hypothetical protein
MPTSFALGRVATGNRAALSTPQLRNGAVGTSVNKGKKEGRSPVGVPHRM